jgi:pyridoxal/pyridoxine/pyridoxamine kinase
MTNENKVTLPREVVESLEKYKSKGESALEIIRIANGDRGIWCPELMKFIEKENGVGDLLSALVNGYNVEKSPEDRVRDYYGRIKDVSNGDDIYDAQAYAIETTLELLGIKIEGVNAE